MLAPVPANSIEELSAPADAFTLSTPNVRELLQLYAGVLDELRERGILRSTNNPVADYAEWLAASALGLELVSNSVAGYDASGPDGTLYQIKGRRPTAAGSSRQLSSIRGLDRPGPAPFDILVGILFRPDFSIMRAAAIPIAVVRELATPDPHVNARRFILRDSVWDAPGVEDITESIAGAASVPAPQLGST
jgi:hypothetical protein